MFNLKMLWNKITPINTNFVTIYLKWKCHALFWHRLLRWQGTSGARWSGSSTSPSVTPTASRSTRSTSLSGTARRARRPFTTACTRRTACRSIPISCRRGCSNATKRRTSYWGSSTRPGASLCPSRASVTAVSSLNPSRFDWVRGGSPASTSSSSSLWLYSATRFEVHYTGSRMLCF